MLNRERMQVPCALVIGGREIEGTTRDVSISGAFVRVTKLVLGGAAVEIGTAVKVVLRFGAGDEAVNAQIVRVDPDEYDASGKPAVGLGVHFQEASAALRGYLRTSRHPIVLLGGVGLAPVAEILRMQHQVLHTASPAEAALTLQDDAPGVLAVEDAISHEPAILVALAGACAVVRIASKESSAQIDNAFGGAKVFHVYRDAILPDELANVVRRAYDVVALREENRLLAVEVSRATALRPAEPVVGLALSRIVGRSPKMRAVLQDLGRIRDADTTVHIAGETGTGKELIARALHDDGPRKAGPFLAQNCAGLTETLMQATLFGHKKGAFTGADRDQPGVFQAAHQGTLFLDEVGELTFPAQASLLRALQNSEITPVGATRPVKVDVRVVSATNKSLQLATMAGRFRSDLYFRLEVITIHLPPLRERDADIPLLAHYFLEQISSRFRKRIVGFTPEALDLLERYPWPGNVRELENVIQRAVVLVDGGKIPAEALPTTVRSASGTSSPAAQRDPSTQEDSKGGGYDVEVKAFERSLVERALRDSGGVISRAAELLQVDRSRLSRIVHRLGLKPAR